jgi:Tol biopolymer transport system component
VDGSGLKILATDAVAAAWSPDGKHIAFGSYKDTPGVREIYVMNADGSNPVNITKNPADDNNPAWSPDGTKIAFTSDRDGNLEIYVMNADGTDPVDLTNNPGYDFSPSWSSK